MSILDLIGDREQFRSRYANLDPETRAMLEARVRTEFVQYEHPTPGHLAQVLDELLIQTPALEVIDGHLLKVRDAVKCMYERRNRLAALRREGVDVKVATERVAEEIPSRGTTRLILSMPPQEGKSWRVSRYNIEWLLRQFPRLRFAIVSYDGDNANQFSYQIRGDIEIFNGQAEQYDLGLRLMRDEKAKGRWTLTTRGGVFAIGIGGGLTGRPVDYMNIDDPVKDYEAADSELQSQKAWEWWQTVGRPRLAPGAPVVLTMTRWHEFDLAGRLMMKQVEDERAGLTNVDTWTVVNIPAQADHNPAKGEVDLLGREPGEFLTSARGRTDADWERVKNGTEPRFWNALYQGRPSPDEGDIWKKEWWRYYGSVLWTQQPDGTYRLPREFEVSQSWDFAFKDKKSSDFVVGQLWAKRGADSFLVTQVRARLTFTASVEAMKRMTHLFPQAKRKVVEDKANGTAIHDSLRHEIPGIVLANPTSSKEARARAVSTFVKAGNVWLPTPEVASTSMELYFSVSEFVSEATSFPNGANDDQVDATSQYLSETYLDGGPASIITPNGLGVSPSSRGQKAVLSPVQARLSQANRK